MRNLFIFLSIVFMGSPLFSQTNIYQYDKTHLKSINSRFQKLPESIREKLQLLIPAVDIPKGLERFNIDERNHIKFITNMTVGKSGLQETYTYYRWDISTQDWSIDPYQQYISIYDLDGNLIELSWQIWDGTVWVNDSRTILTYDSNGNWTEYLRQYWNVTVWVNDRRFLYIYDSNGYLIEFLDQNWDGTVWVNNWQDLYTYDSNGFITEYLSQNWDGTAWVNDLWEFYTYDSNGLLTEWLVQNWDGTIWVNDSIRFYTYDSNGNRTEWLVQNWDGTVWVNFLRDLYTYDSNGNWTEYLHQNWDTTNWLNDRQNLRTYDTNGNLIEDIHQTWDGVNWVNDYIVYVDYTSIVGVDESEVVPAEYSLEQNYPNPFNPTTTIEYTLLSPGEVNLIIYNLLGQEIARLVSKVQQAGNHRISWDASNMASGVYIYELIAGDYVQTRKMLLLK